MAKILTESVAINDTGYNLVSDFKHDIELRTSFNELAQAVFHFNFESWYQSGFWGDNYIPYSLMHDERIISNVSISRIEFDILGEHQVGIQIGTVMTAEDYRHKGLNKFLLDRVIANWKNEADFIYLFANESVLDFYPKFGFKAMDEYQYSKTIKGSANIKTSRKLNLDDHKDKELFIDIVNRSQVQSRISMRNNLSLIMFYSLLIMKDNIHYIQTIDTIVVADYEEDTLTIKDIFSPHPVNIHEVVQLMSQESIKKVAFGFTPFNTAGLDSHQCNETDKLFVLKGATIDLASNQWMFPVLSHA
ncbi:MAG: GNAT family N-acetyltransferase [Bacteroidota bacterium]